MPPRLRLNRLASAALAVAAVFTLDACSSSPKIKGVPSRLPDIDLGASSRTPSHGMAHGDYPFDSSGNYVTAWVAEGGASAEPDDTRSSSSSRRSSTSSTRKSTGSTTSKSKSTASKSKSKSSGGSRRHTVKSGDSLWSIARKYGTTVAKIKSANGLKSDTIRDGRSLSIPR